MHEQIIEDLNWRYATKKFDPTKKIDPKDLETLLEVLRLTPTSYGLQPLKFIVVENTAVRKALRSKSYNQSQITDASHLIVFCSYTAISDEDIERHIENTAKTRSIEPQILEGYGNFMKRTLNEIEQKELEQWAAHQAYIALGQFLHACAQLRIDAIPMEGFEKEAYGEILQLPERNLTATLVCPIGYRSQEDTYQEMKKVRKQKEDLFEWIP